MINNISLVNRGVKSVFYICTICFFCISILAYIFRAPAHAADTFVTNSTDQTSLKVIFDLMAELFGGNTKSSEEQMRSQCASLAEIEKYLNENPEHKAEAEKQLAELRQSCANHPPTTKLDVDIPDDIQVSDDERFPYVNYGLTYTIPIRDTTVLPRADVVNVILRGQLSNFRSAKVEYIPAITETAIKLGWNPAFLITLWLEETGGSMYTIPPYGAGLGKAASHMGCNPFGGVRTIQHEIENCIHASFGHFTNSQFANFMARYSTGSCTTPCDSNDQTCRKDVKADLMRGICTGNPFKSPDQKANNPHFPAGIRAVYNLVVPPGSHGALIEYSGKPVSPKPLVTQTDARDRTTPLGTSESIGASIANPVYYSQCDQSWGDKHMRGCASFCKVGCAITSAAMIYSTYSDSRVTPDIFLNKYLKYYSDCNIESTALKKSYA
jgi:hypothetical protein